MPREYVGHLSSRDPLHPYLVHDVLPQMGVRNSVAEFRVFSMKHSKVYLYEECHSRTQVVGKFFVDGGHDLATDPSGVRRTVGIIFQKPSLDLNLTAEENVRLHAILYGLFGTTRVIGAGGLLFATAIVRNVRRVRRASLCRPPAPMRARIS